MAKAARNSAKSNPFFVQTVTINSLHAQQVFERGFRYCAKGVFALSVILRMLTTEKQAREVEGIVDERLNKAFEEIRSEAARLEQLAEANGIEFGAIQYSNPKQIDAQITSPRAARYLGIIREFDGVVARLDTLWLSGLIPDGEYSTVLYRWKRNLLRLAGSIRMLAIRAIAAARRKREEERKAKQEKAAGGQQAGGESQAQPAGEGQTPALQVEQPAVAAAAQ